MDSLDEDISNDLEELEEISLKGCLTVQIEAKLMKELKSLAAEADKIMSKNKFGLF